MEKKLLNRFLFWLNFFRIKFRENSVFTIFEINLKPNSNKRTNIATKFKLNNSHTSNFPFFHVTIVAKRNFWNENYLPFREQRKPSNERWVKKKFEWMDIESKLIATTPRPLLNLINQKRENFPPEPWKSDCRLPHSICYWIFMCKLKWV